MSFLKVTNTVFLTASEQKDNDFLKENLSRIIPEKKKIIVYFEHYV